MPGWAEIHSYPWLPIQDLSHKSKDRCRWSRARRARIGRQRQAHRRAADNRLGELAIGIVRLVDGIGFRVGIVQRELAQLQRRLLARLGELAVSKGFFHVT